MAQSTPSKVPGPSTHSLTLQIMPSPGLLFKEPTGNIREMLDDNEQWGPPHPAIGREHHYYICRRGVGGSDRMHSAFRRDVPLTAPRGIV
jgi:hypothetical protein